MKVSYEPGAVLAMTLFASTCACNPPAARPTSQVKPAPSEAAMASPDAGATLATVQARHVHTVRATARGVLVDGQPHCTATVTLGDGYDQGCSEHGLGVRDLPRSPAGADNPADGESDWVLEVEDHLPLVAVAQVIVTLYRADMDIFTLVTRYEAATHHQSPSARHALHPSLAQWQGLHRSRARAPSRSAHPAPPPKSHDRRRAWTPLHPRRRAEGAPQS